MRPTRRLLSMLLAFALIGAACGSDDDTDDQSSSDDTSGVTTEADTGAVDAGGDEPDDGESTDEGEAPDDGEATDEGEGTDDGSDDGAATDDGEGSDEGTELSGDPVLVGFVGTSLIAGEASFDAVVNGMEAATIAINNDGGIDGRPIEVLICDDLGDPNLAVECAQQLIDAGVVTFVANFTPFGDAVNPVIGEAGYVIIGGGLFTPGDFGVEFLYSTNGGAFTAGAGGPVACIIVGGTRLVYAYVDVPAGAQVPPLVEALVTGPRDGIDLVHSEPIGFVQADFAPSAAKILGADPDCISAAVNLPQVPPLIQALRDQGYDGQIQIAGDFNTAEAVIEALGDAANNVVLADIYDQTSPGYAEYVAAVAETTGDNSPPLPLGAMGWLGLHVAADVIRAAGDDPAAIAAAIPEVVVNYDTGGLTATPLDWSVPGVNPLGITNLRDVSVMAREIVDGEIVFFGEWEPIFVG